MVGGGGGAGILSSLANEYLPFFAPIENKNLRVIIFKFTVIRGKLTFFLPANNFMLKYGTAFGFFSLVTS